MIRFTPDTCALFQAAAFSKTARPNAAFVSSHVFDWASVIGNPPQPEWPCPGSNNHLPVQEFRKLEDRPTLSAVLKILGMTSQ